MQFTMYSRFNPTLAKLGADATADYAANLGFSSVEVLETTSPGHPSVISDRETAKNVRKIKKKRNGRPFLFFVQIYANNSDKAWFQRLHHAI